MAQVCATADSAQQRTAADGQWQHGHVAHLLKSKHYVEPAGSRSTDNGPDSTGHGQK